MGLRRKGREVAVQTLYSLEYLELDSFLRELEFLEKYPTKLDDIAADREINKTDKVYIFAEDILKGMIQNIDIIDSKISEQSIHWPIDKIASWIRAFYVLQFMKFYSQKHLILLL